MNASNEQHLNEDQLLRAVIDIQDLTAPLRGHLAGCRQCLDQKARFEADLGRIGKMAQQAAPQLRKRIILPARESKKPVWAWSVWKGAFAAAAVTAVLVLAIWLPIQMRSPLPGDSANLAREMQEAAKLMAEVDMLVENALPPVYNNISGETAPQLDDDFMQFLIPSIEDDPQASMPEKKGLA